MEIMPLWKKCPSVFMKSLGKLFLFRTFMLLISSTGSGPAPNMVVHNE